MKCFNCGEEVNPTLVYCAVCGAPLEVDVDDLLEEEERRAGLERSLTAKEWAKDKFVLTAFLFACVVGLRIAVLKKQHYDAFAAFFVPSTLLEENDRPPPAALEVPPLQIPLPTGD